MKKVIFGISGTSLTKGEFKLFKTNPVVGFILFNRNIQTKQQLRELTATLKKLYPNREVPIFIDQEGGRVARIKPPIAKKLLPSSKHLGIEYKINKIETLAKVKNNYIELMSELKDFGINSPCAPVCDIEFDDASNIIGDRSFGNNPKQVIDLCRSAINGISKAGGIPFIKHIPGHGRALVDSHFELPIVNTPLSILEQTDFSVFKSLANEDVWGMTAHIIYKDLDPDNPATLSPKVIKYIREQIGFKNTLISDDICMYALHGDIGKKISILQRALKINAKNKDWKNQYDDELNKLLNLNIREMANIDINQQLDTILFELKPYFIDSLSKITRMILDAGCDIVLHCSGDLDEMRAICRQL